MTELSLPCPNMDERLRLFKPAFGDEELRAVSEVLASGWIGRGPRTLEFEERFADYIGCRNAVSLNSATAALHLAMIAAEVEGQEVLTSSLTFVSSTQAIVLAGGRPVFCDIDPETLNVTADELRKKITPTTRAIMVVHYGGHSCDMDPIMALANEHGLTVIEDTAHGCGGLYKGRKLGSLGHMGCFSFQATKNLTTGDGGMLVTDSDVVADRARKLRWAGISKPTWERFSSGKPRRSWIYDVEEIGYKYEMNDLAAAIGLVQLDKLETLNHRRRELMDRYREAFSEVDGIEVLTNRGYALSACYNAVIKLSNRDDLYGYLDDRGIDSNVHFYPNHLMEIFKPYTTRLPVTEREWERILVLPLHATLTESEQERVILAVRNFVSRRCN